MLVVTVTVVVPTGKVVPETFEYVTTGASSAASVTVTGAKLTVAPVEPVASIVMFAGTVEMTGAVVSRTVTVKLAVDVLAGEAVSDAENVTVVVVGPGAVNGKIDPEARDAATGRLPLTTSDAVGMA